MNTRTALRRARRGFTLIELLAVIAIMGLLMGIVAVSVAGWQARTKVKLAKVQIQNFEHALDLYKNQHNNYPSTAEGLEALIKDKLLSSDFVPKDPWGNDYAYYFPGSTRYEKYDIISYGADKLPGGEGDSADISNWTIEEEQRQGVTGD